MTSWILIKTRNMLGCFNPIQGGGAKTPALHFFIKLLLKGSSKLLLQWSVISILYINKGLKQKKVEIFWGNPPFSPSKKFQNPKKKLGVPIG